MARLQILWPLATSAVEIRGRVIDVSAFLWGVAGLLLAVPMLASIKIVAERVPGWQPWAKLIE